MYFTIEVIAISKHKFPFGFACFTNLSLKALMLLRNRYNLRQHPAKVLVAIENQNSCLCVSPMQITIKTLVKSVAQ